MNNLNTLFYPVPVHIALPALPVPVPVPLSLLHIFPNLPRVNVPMEIDPRRSMGNIPMETEDPP